MELNDYIDAVLLNNPYAVQENLIQRGILQAGSYDPDTLKQVIVQTIRGAGGEEDRLYLLPDLLDVPLQPAGPYAEELAQVQYTSGNRAMIESLLPGRVACSTYGLSADWSQLLQKRITWSMAIRGLWLFVGLLFIIYFIRKI